MLEEKNKIYEKRHVFDKVPLDDMELSDNFLFSAICEEEEMCQLFLQILLGKQVSQVQHRQIEMTMELAPETRGIRMDVYFEADGEIYNIEMQNGQKKNLYQRIRYYQSMIAVNLLKTGDDYNKLPPVTTIFICTYDPFEQGYSQYHLETLCEEDSALFRGLGERAVVFNCTAWKHESDPEISALMAYIMGVEQEVPYQGKIPDKVEEIKENIRRRNRSMYLELLLKETLEEGWDKGREEGREEGAYFNAVKSAKNMMVLGQSDEIICAFLDLDEGTVRKIREELEAES